MQITIDMSQSKINWNAKGAERIAQNILNLFNTYKYEIAYDRTLGMAGKYIDKPQDEAISLATAEIYELVAEREPRARVMDVIYTGRDDKSVMQFKVVIEIE